MPELPSRHSSSDRRAAVIVSSRIFFSALAGLGWYPILLAQTVAHAEDASQLAPKGELRAALIASNPVLVTRGADGGLGGVSVELARALAAKLNVPVRLVPYENPARYNESLGKDEWDVGFAARDPSRAEYLAFSDVFMEVDNGYVGRPGLLLKTSEEVDRPGVRVAVAQGSAPDGYLTRTLKNVEIVRVPGGLVPAREVLATASADVYGENVHLAYRIAADLPGATVLEGRFNLVQMSIAVPKAKAAMLPVVNDFIRDAKSSGSIAQSIVRAALRGVRTAP